METRSKTGSLKTAYPSDDVKVVYSFPPGNEWSKEELTRLNVTFDFSEKKELRSLQSVKRLRDIAIPDGPVKDSIVLVGSTDISRYHEIPGDIGEDSNFGFAGR
jgi:hypothetical protein